MSAHYVTTDAIKAALKGRETDVLGALGINWRAGRPHITCPYPGHHDGDPSWRWDARKGRAYCTCIEGSDSALDVLMKYEGLDFETAKVRGAELLGRADLIRNGAGRQPRRSRLDAESLLSPHQDERDDRLPIAYLAHRLGVTGEAVPLPRTHVVGWKGLPYYDPPATDGAKPALVGTYPCAVFGTVAADGRTHAHRIYLAEGGAGKADLGDGAAGRPRDAKKSAKVLGDDNTSGRSVLWGDAGWAPHVIVTEGIETGAAIALALKDEICAGDVVVAAATSAIGVEAFQPYPATKRITIAADRDEAPKNGKPGSRRGEQAAREFGLRHHETLDVAIALPGKPGESIDWLDVLRRDGAWAVRDGILAASPFARGNGALVPLRSEVAAVEVPPPPEPKYPDPLAEEAFHGIAGDFVRRIEPHTEADPAGILIQFLVAVGNACGRGLYFRVEATRHHLNMFAVLVGQTSKSRKGTSLGRVKEAIIAVNPNWERCVLRGLSTGEGLIEAVRDARFGTDKKGKQIVLAEAVTDKRLLVIEEEFARVLRVAARPGNTLSSLLRDAWDSPKTINVQTKTSPTRATAPHISMIGHITVRELMDLLTETDATNGVGNRFLWVFVKRSKLLPFGGDDPDLSDITQRLTKILGEALSERSMTFSRDAARVWKEVYTELSRERDGLLGAMLARGEAQVLRLSEIYSALDGMRSIEVPHLRAALAVWEYCERSAIYIFGDDLDNTVADRIVGALRCVEGPLPQTELHNLFCRHLSGKRLLTALDDLQRRGLVRAVRLPSTGGRPKTVWEAVG